MIIFRSSFSDFASKYGKEERFKGIEKMRDREGLFSGYVSDLRRKEKEEKSNQKEKVCIPLLHDGSLLKCSQLCNIESVEVLSCCTAQVVIPLCT